MKNRPCTVGDVAAAVGVSLMTVSRAMNGRPGVGAELRARVLRTADRLGYRPSRVARGLASRRTSTLGIVLPDISNPFFSILAKAATDVARAADMNVFIVNTEEAPALELEALASLAGESIDGVIVAGSRLPDTTLRRAIARFDAAVLVNRLLVGPRVDVVNVDDRIGALEAVSHLVRTGRRRVAHCAGPAASRSGRRRLAGYRAGLREAGLEADLIEPCAPSLDGGAEGVRRLLERDNGVDAIFAYNDLVAIGAMHELEALGRRVPADVAVIGADDVPYASLVSPSLTTVHVDISALGAQAMSRLLALGNGEKLDPARPLRPELVVRESA